MSKAGNLYHICLESIHCIETFVFTGVVTALIKLVSFAITESESLLEQLQVVCLIKL